MRHFTWAATAHLPRRFVLAQNQFSMGRWCFILHLALEDGSLEKEEKGRFKKGMEGWRKPGRLCTPGGEEQICFVRRPVLDPPQSLFSHHPSLSQCFFYSFSLSPFLLFFFFLHDFNTFFPSTCLAAGYGWGEMERNRGGWFQTHIPSGRDGRAAELHRPVNNKMGRILENMIWNMTYIKSTPSPSFSLCPNSRMCVCLWRRQ